MRKLLAATGLCLVLAQANVASAQAPQSRPYEEAASQTPATRLSFTQQNVYSRASQAARERESRMLTRKWMGFTPERPTYRMISLGDLDLGRGSWDRYHISRPVYRSWYAW